MDEEKIENSIIYNKLKIDEIQMIKNRVVLSETEKIRIKIETKRWYGFAEPFLSKEIDKIEIQKSTAIEILDEIQNKHQQNIDKLIDMEIERRKNTSD